MHISFLKYIDSWMGLGLVKLAAFITPGRARERKCVFLIIRPGGVGDAALLIPAINALQRIYPNAAIDIIAEKRNAGVFTLCQAIRQIYRYDKVSELYAVLKRKYDVVIDAEQWYRLSAVVARMTRSPVIIGYGTNDRRNLFTHVISYSQDTYEAQSFFDLLEPLAGKVIFNPEGPFLTIPKAVEEKAFALLTDALAERTVALFPGSSIPERQWGKDRFHAVAKVLSNKGYGIVVVGGKQDREAGAAIIRNITGGVSLCGRLTLSETAAVLKRSALLITGDSGIMHIGYGVGTKVLALFGPGREMKWAPRGRGTVVINKKLDCSPCTTFGNTPRCRRDAACMKAISVDEVVSTALTMLFAG